MGGIRMTNQIWWFVIVWIIVHLPLLNGVQAVFYNPPQGISVAEALQRPILAEEDLIYLKGELEQGRDDDATDPCNPKNCQATFYHSFSVPVTLPCETASGEIPQAPHLPLVYPGDYDQCQHVYGFAGGHYCTIETKEFQGVPLRYSKFNYTGEGLVLSRLHLGKCVQKACTAQDLRRWFLKRVKITATKLRLRMPLDLTIPFLEERIINTTEVRCVDEDEKKCGSIWDHAGSTAVTIMCLFLVFLPIIATGLDLILRPTPRSPGILLLTSISLRRSMASLVKPMGGDFLVLNGIRVTSMVWVMYGHVVLFSYGYVTPFPISNPSTMDQQFQSFYIMISRAAEFSVDTFFFMSAFLACFGALQEEISKGNLEGKFHLSTYFRAIVLRYTRLTPVYLFTLFMYMKLMPFMGTGPFYDAAEGVVLREAECKNWWTNLAYINNLIPYGVDGGLSGCAGWTWYLANDMQFFLLVLPCCCFFLRCRGRWTGYLPPLALVTLQLASTWWTMDTYDIRGAFDKDYNAYLYVKPWCRVAPYAVGIIFAFWHYSRTSSERGKVWWKSAGELFYGIPPILVASSAFAVMVIVGFAPYYQIRCEADDPRTDCNVPGGIAVYGAVVAKNWSHDEITAYFVLSYLGWSLAIGLLFVYLFSGRGGIVNTLLSHQALVPLARLSYNVYLVHIPMIRYMYTTSTRPLYVSKSLQFTDSVVIIVLAYLVSFVLYLFVERPFMTLVSLILNASGRRPKTITERITSVATGDGNAVDLTANGRTVEQPLLA